MEKLSIEVEDKKQTLSLSDLEGSFNDAINTFTDWKDQYESKCDLGETCNLCLDYCGSDGTFDLNVRYYRQETDEEFKVRLEKEQERLIKQQAKELEQLKKLQEKYKEVNI